MFVYNTGVDFSDVAQLTVFRCEGVQLALEEMAKKFNCETEKASDGTILALKSERELTDEELQEMNQAIQKGWENYIATK